MAAKGTAILRALVLACVLGLGACSSSDAQPTAERQLTSDIEIDTFVFQPKTLSVPVGTTVRWNNGDDILHTITSGRQKKQGVPGVSDGAPARPDGTFDLELDGRGTTASFTFDQPGTYNYFCEVHAAMTGRVIVK